MDAREDVRGAYMARMKAAKRRQTDPTPRWRAVRGPLGDWRVVDGQGREVLRSADPTERLFAAHLAAAAPAMLDALRELARRLTYLELPYSADARRLMAAHSAIGDAIPSLRDQVEAMRQAGQQEFTLDVEDTA